MQDNISQDQWISRSFAKINLGLQVMDRLSTGFHEICTGFCFISWHDRLSMTRAKDFQLTLTDERIPANHQNLIVKALHILKKYAIFEDQWAVHVEKRIPAGAGLGGGSSNAATILRMISKACDLKLNAEDLARLASGLGADVPVFLHGKPAIGAGIGHNLEFVPIQPKAWIVTVFPDIHVSTAEAYRHCSPNPEPEYSVGKILKDFPPDEWKILLQNDLEPWVIHRHPQVGHLKDQLYELGAIYASMSGSGSSVFGLFEQEFVALDAYRYLANFNLKVNVTDPEFIPDFGIYRNT